ncbi:MAG: RNA methyltransferase [Flavobacteriales bacterium]|nr:RNA methyltransferase [Flavobacteriales bacterium]
MSTVPVIRAVRALHQKKQRDEQGAFLVQGPKLVAELLAAGWAVRTIHATAEQAARFVHERIVIHPPHDLDRMGTLESGNQVIAVAEKPRPGPFDPLAEGELVLALDGIADPGNMGTILRIADWFGVKRVLCSNDSVEEFNPKCVQASMGSLFRVLVHRTHLALELDRLRAAGAVLYLASMEGGSVFDTKLKRPAVLILGSESHGPSEAVRALGSRTVAVPRAGHAESLNVAMAASALCMEFLRQARTP